jgi:carboxylesterase
VNRFAPTRLRSAIGVGAVLLAVLAAAWALLGRIPPVSDPGPPRPAATFADALARVDSMRALDGPGLNSACRTRVLTGSAKAANAIVLLHGFTNCPKQLDSLAARFARRGYNVLVPRVPRHGQADRMTTELAHLTAEELTRSGMDAVDIARGLGDRVTVMGLSSSAVVTAWLAQHRTDVDCAVLLAPSFAPRGMRAVVARRMTNALLRLPNFYVWWDRKLKAQVPGPDQCYPRFASRALAQVYRLGFTTLDDAGHARPEARRLVILTTALDEGVNNDVTRELARRWREHGANVRTYEFPESLGVRHDMLDPEQPYQRVGVSYPVIEELVAEAAETR